MQLCYVRKIPDRSYAFRSEYLFVSLSVHFCVYISVCICTYVYLCTCICVCIWSACYDVITFVQFVRGYGCRFLVFFWMPLSSFLMVSVPQAHLSLNTLPNMHFQPQAPSCQHNLVLGLLFAPLWWLAYVMVLLLPSGMCRLHLLTSYYGLWLAIALPLIYSNWRVS